MKAHASFVLGVALTSSVFVGSGLVRPERPSQIDTARANDGAYRDGLFVGKTHAHNRLQQHIASGRWASDADRRSFAEGYRRGYDTAATQP
jgi:hypothetical protein